MKAQALAWDSSKTDNKQNEKISWTSVCLVATRSPTRLSDCAKGDLTTKKKDSATMSDYQSVEGIKDTYDVEIPD